jgi:hypothetical protein
MATPSIRPKVARFVRTRPVSYLGRRFQYAELRVGAKVLDRIPIGDGSSSLSQASTELRKTARKMPAVQSATFWVERRERHAAAEEFVYS